MSCGENTVDVDNNLIEESDALDTLFETPRFLRSIKNVLLDLYLIVIWSRQNNFDFR